MAMPRWMKWTLGGFGALLLLVVVLAGAGLWYLSSTLTPDVALGEPLPRVELASLDGAPIELEGYRGQVVVLDFWSSW